MTALKRALTRAISSNAGGLFSFSSLSSPLQHFSSLASSPFLHLSRSFSPSQAPSPPTLSPPPPGARLERKPAGGRDQIPLKSGRPRLVILGSGWAAARLARDTDPKLYDMTVISPRNHMVFTPLLASCTTGTLEGRSVAMPILDLQPALRDPTNHFYNSKCTEVFPEDQTLQCESVDGLKYYIDYDYLAICTGSQGSTFGIKGVEEHAFFLREISHADAIRRRLIDNVGAASLPPRSESERSRLLHTVIVGGGPTGVEFAGELTDLIRQDLHRLRPDVAGEMRVTLIEAHELLGSFDASLREYAARKLMRRGVHLRKGVVKEVLPDRVALSDGHVIPYGLLVWSTGVGPTPFITGLPFKKAKSGRLAVDDFLRVSPLPPTHLAGSADPGQDPHPPQGWKGKQTVAGLEEGPASGVKQGGGGGGGAAEGEGRVWENVFALGDCCANLERPLPALAQVAEQQGKYLAQILNERAGAGKGGNGAAATPAPQPFQYRSLGSMATVGGTSAILEFDSAEKKGFLSLKGFASWVAWRSAYLTRLGSMRNRLYVAMNWTTTLIFGRDLSRW